MGAEGGIAIRVFGAMLAVMLPPQLSATQRLETLREATVMVETVGAAGIRRGSGVVVSEAGVVATAAHVLAGATGGRVRLFTGEFLDIIGVIEYDASLDLALIRVKGSALVSGQLGHSDDVRIGQRLYAVGCPLGLAVSVADGLLSARTTDNGVDLLQISIPVSVGYSGGPVATEDGIVIGIVTTTVTGPGVANIGFALPANYLRQMLDRTDRQVRQSLADAARQPVSRGEDQVAVSSPGRAEPERVNVGLSWDYPRLNGIEVSIVRQGAGRSSFATLVRYAVNPGTDGDLVVERLSETEMRDQDVTVGRERIRTVMHVGGSGNHFAEFLTYVSENDAALFYSSTLEVAASTYRFTAKAGLTVAGRAPLGVLPPHFLDAAIGALVSPTPSPQTISILDPKQGRIIPAVLELGAPVLRKIPFGEATHRCGPKAHPVKQQRRVFIGKLTVGLTRQPVMVLAEPPFLPLDGSITCVWLP